MIRIAVLLGIFSLSLSSCTTPEPLAIPPLPLEGQGVAYGDVLTRLRLQSGAANEAFFTDDYDQLGGRARDIEQTAAVLPKTVDAPKTVQGRLADEATRLTAEARKLFEAARTRNEDQIRDALRKIHSQIRMLPPATRQ
jgi:hypothetical protein